jgi:hypothetical protein
VVEPSRPESVLLHYKYIDPQGYCLERQKALGRRLLPGDREQGFGAQYRLSNEVMLRSFAWLTMHATDVVGRPAPLQ